MIGFYIKLETKDVDRIREIVGTDLVCHIGSSIGRIAVNTTSIKVIFSKCEFEGACRIEDLVADKLLMLR